MTFKSKIPSKARFPMTFKWRNQMPFHKAGAYDGFDSITEAKEHYKRCRKLKHFILSQNGAEKEKPICSHCKKPITSDTNRCMYFPKMKRIIAHHYYCAWESLLKQVFALADYL